MKVLYAAYRHDPMSRGAEVGADYAFLQTLKANRLDVRVVGPFTSPPIFLERIVKRIYKKLTGKNYMKYDISNTLRASREVTRIAKEWRPDVIFSLYPPPLAIYSGDIPCVFRTDATFIGSSLQSPEFQAYGKLAHKVNVWLERRTIRKSARVVTHSEWVRQSLIIDYELDHQKIVVYPNPSALPDEWIPQSIDIQTSKTLTDHARLLFIGRDPYRKGLDIAIEVVELLNRSEFPAHLQVCGLQGENLPFVTYFGNLSKFDELDRAQYLRLLQTSHLLIHPARFDPSPRVVAEAAAFGTPTVTNDIGGLATSVKHGVSGIVLPRNSPTEVYAQLIRNLLLQPEHYYALCDSTRKHYELGLNTRSAGEQLLQVLEGAVNGCT